MSVLARLRSFCVFSIVAVVWGIKYHEPHVDILAANQYWRAVNCDSLGVQDPQVFAAVRHAIKTEHREVYLAINTAWMDRFLNPGQRVVVTCVRASELAWSHLEQYAHNDDELHALYTLGRVDQSPNPPSASASATASAYQEPDADAGRRAALDLRLSALLPAVDRFLLHNPCWLVLRDGLSFHFPSSSTYNASTNTRLRHRGSTSPHGTDSSNSLSADPSFVSASLFVRLPSNPLGVTCRLFEAVTRRQFPATGCPTDSHEMFFYAMQNFGFGGEANKLIKTFAFNLADSASRIYARPLADRLHWSWAEPNELTPSAGTSGTSSGLVPHRHCPKDIYTSDPWSCTFLPISNCSFFSFSGDANSEHPVDIMKNLSSGWGNYGPTKNTVHKFLAAQDISSVKLEAHKDGSSFSAEPATWVSVRLYPFLLRPNVRSRALIRRALDKRIARLLPARRGGAGTEPEPHIVQVSLLRREGVREANDDQENSPASSSNPSDVAVVTSTPASASASTPAPSSGIHNNQHHMWTGTSCLGMHVRNADVLTDWRKGRSTDRSLNAHVHLARNLSTSLALKDVFLATDNSSLLYIAPTEYPEFRWFAQVRPIRPLSEQMARGDRHHLHESEPQREIANLLMDALLIGRCEAFVGQGDGSVTLLFHMFSCNLFSAEAACPPMVDLQWISGEGVMPYIGKRAGAQFFAAFGFV